MLCSLAKQDRSPQSTMSGRPGTLRGQGRDSVVSPVSAPRTQAASYRPARTSVEAVPAGCRYGGSCSIQQARP